jgi:hypothetical protein
LRAGNPADTWGARVSIFQHGGIGLRGEPGSLVWNELMSMDLKSGSAF